MTYSFCTICKGRLHTLEKVLFGNLAFAEKYPNFEFVLLNYDSPDGLDKWVKKKFYLSFERYHLRYGSFFAGPYLRLSHAKNLAHKLAFGDILINLDADNMLTQSYIDELLNVFEGLEGNNSVLCSNYNSSITGRIALPREMFFALKGYDEAFLHYGYEDIDLIESNLVTKYGEMAKGVLKIVKSDFKLLNN